MKFEPFEMKVGQRTYIINEHDRIIFNGVCYLLVTRTYQSGWNRITPKLAKSKAEKYIKQGYLVEGSKTQSSGVPTIYYRFTGCPED